MATILRQEQHGTEWRTWVEGDADNSIMVITDARVTAKEAEAIQEQWLAGREEESRRVVVSEDDYKAALEAVVTYAKDERAGKQAWATYLESLTPEARKAIVAMDEAETRKDANTP